MDLKNLHRVIKKIINELIDSKMYIGEGKYNERNFKSFLRELVAPNFPKLLPPPTNLNIDLEVVGMNFFCSYH